MCRVIRKSLKHFKNSQQINHSADHGSSYADIERNSPSFFLHISQMLNVSTFGNTADIFAISQIKHQLDATLCRFYFCRVNLHVSGVKRPSSGVFKTSTAATGTCVIVAGKSSHLLIRAEGLRP